MVQGIGVDDTSVAARLEWARIVSLARQLHDEQVSGRPVGPHAWVSLAQSIMLFQARLLGRFVSLAKH
jgi:hypothetical protein